MAHVYRGDGARPLARGKVVQAGDSLPLGRRHASVQKMPRDEPRVNASVRDVVGLLEGVRQTKQNEREWSSYDIVFP